MDVSSGYTHLKKKLHSRIVPGKTPPNWVATELYYQDEAGTELYLQESEDPVYEEEPQYVEEDYN